MPSSLIWKDQSFATGGWGPNEAFVEPGKGQLGASLSNTPRSFETPCGAYAHFKVMRYLLALTRDARYGDSMERVLYNTILGAWPVREDGSSFYYSDYHHSGVKTYRRDIPGAPTDGITMPDGRAARERCLRSSPTTPSARTSAAPTAST